MRDWVDSKPNGYLVDPSLRQIQRVAAKLGVVVDGWAKAIAERGMWSEVKRAQRLHIISTIVGEEVRTTKDLPDAWVECLDQWLGQGWKPRPLIAELLIDRFGL